MNKLSLPIRIILRKVKNHPQIGNVMELKKHKYILI